MGPGADRADAAGRHVRGRSEHTTRHHLYARFITHALHDLGLIGFREPFAKLRLHGLIVQAGAKMSKSRGNVVNPDEYVGPGRRR